MSFWILYFIAFIPLIIGGLFCIFNKKEFTWQEWVANTVFCFVVAGICHACAVSNATSDVETWSGKVTSVKHIPTWVEAYQITHTVTHTSGSGKNQITWTTTYVTHHTETHTDEYMVFTNLPDLVMDIDIKSYNQLRGELGAKDNTVKGRRSTWKEASHMIGGDPNDYDTPNTTGVIIPLTNTYSFENRVKAASTIFSFAHVPDNIQLPEYPANNNHFISDRLIGSANVLNIRPFDEMNSRLGPTKKVNVILVGLNGKSSAYGKWLEAKWMGGKKNDVVIVWGGSNKKPDWTYVFGWTDRKTVLRSLESITLDNGISEATLPLIEKEINQSYQLKNWHDFDYITIPVSKGWVMGFTIFTLLSQCALMWWYNHNEFKLFTPYRRYYP